MQPTATVLGQSEALDNNTGPQDSVPLERSSFCSEAEFEGELALADAEPSPEWIAEIISKMEPTRPEAVRATRVQNVLHSLARPLRVRGDFYQLSQSTTRLHAFWSHSWHGSVSQKVATLFFLHKAGAAATAGTGAAVVACIAFGLGALPDDGGNSWWCLSLGCLGYLLTMLFWRPQQLVFVDRVCISQTDPTLQAEGTFSLGAIVKRADTMLVLWDPSWARRLWCVYELAAFICSRSPGERPCIIIRPTMLGFVMCACWLASALGGFTFHFTNHTIGLDYASGRNEVMMQFISIAFCGLIFWYIAHLLREYCRDVAIMCQHIGCFRVETAESFCCSVKHRRPGCDQTMMCDREVMQKCINIWFGGLEAFEQHVQSDLCDLLVDQLSNHMVSYWRLAEASPVFLWFHLDVVAHHLWYFTHLAEDGAVPTGILKLLVGLSYWLAVVPMLFRIMFRLSWAMQARCRCRLLDYFKSLLLLLPGISIFGALVFLHFYLSARLPYDLGSLIFALITSPLAALVWRSLPVPLPQHNMRLAREHAQS